MGSDTRQCVKVLMICFNLLFLLVGAGLCLLGVSVLSNDYLNLKHLALLQNFIAGSGLESLQLVAIYVVAVGGITAFISFLGCCGACKENKCMLIAFAVFLGLIFLAQVAVGIFAFLMKDEIMLGMRVALAATMEYYGKHEQLTGAWDNLQTTSTCCGTVSADDWKNFNTTFHGRPNRPFWPDSCCSTGMVEGCATNDTVEPYPLGCESLVMDRLGDLGKIVGGNGVGSGLVQLLGVGFACFLAKKKKRNGKTVTKETETDDPRPDTPPAAQSTTYYGNVRLRDSRL